MNLDVKKETKAYFDSVAEKFEGYYDAPTLGNQLRHTFVQERNRRHILTYLQSIKSKNTPLKNILDAGCGNGDFSNRLAREFPDALVHGVDFSMEMLRLAKKRRRNEIRRLSFSRQDLSRPLAFPTETFDLTICLNLLHHIPPERQNETLRELTRITRSHLILEIKRRHLLFSALTRNRAFGFLPVFPTSIREVRQTIESAGFVLERLLPVFRPLFLCPVVVLAWKRKETNDRCEGR